MGRLKMTIVKHSKDSNLPVSRKKRLRYGIDIKKYIPSILLGSLISTYLDLYFIGKGMYYFPHRPLPSIFSINIIFLLIGLPLLIILFLIVCEKINGWKKLMFILFISLSMAVFEKFSESLGYFVHDDSWKHIYSLFGYFTFFTFIYFFNRINKCS
ncbi:CBO0543 family protein [Bacillus sp. Bva_UNVM-123]|uniref:CBO0543 family protein n=1 Tax=Bacillus sp. Bva_UNVM-123 TaxID=2829798 RepID=UPI00391F1962